ncbi:MAG: glycoside hydrolase family 43 protein [Armatimonadetes bacterium]|nr:glycoside hydrolase family 43 protein [Armatimonadota bacterium]
MKKIINPILPGFNPDPSICRVGDDYYIATSTFEWFPGVQVHHSKDLIHWKLVAHPLDRRSQLDMNGCASSCGIWAPCLSYAEGQFWLIYTNMRSVTGPWLSTPNYLVTAPSIEGPWSEPVYMNASGFDPSLFHDDDGRKWFVNMLFDGSGRRHCFAGIVLQEYDHAQKKLVGPIKNIWGGTPLKVTEGPHLYKREGWYYLMCAEGGTDWTHAESIARSRNIAGPYESNPANPILTSYNKTHLPLHRAGHASLVETQTGEWYMPHLCGRPVENPGASRSLPFYDRNKCIMGRETAIQKIVWGDDGWPRLAWGGNDPRLEVDAPNLPERPWPAEPIREDFDGPAWSIHFQTLREPADESWISLTERPGWLRLRGRHWLSSFFDQSLLVRRVQAFDCRATTCMEFEPTNIQQMAGLVAYYNYSDFLYLRGTANDDGKKSLGIIVSDQKRYRELSEYDVPVDGIKRIYLRAQINAPWLQFSWSKDGGNWTDIGPKMNCTNLSDEISGTGSRFTGAFLGICCQDMSGQFIEADFDWFEYGEVES